MVKLCVCLKSVFQMKIRRWEGVCFTFLQGCNRYLNNGHCYFNRGGRIYEGVILVPMNVSHLCTQGYKSIWIL